MKILCKIFGHNDTGNVDHRYVEEVAPGWYREKTRVVCKRCGKKTTWTIGPFQYISVDLISDS